MTTLARELDHMNWFKLNDDLYFNLDNIDYIQWDDENKYFYIAFSSGQSFELCVELGADLLEERLLELDRKSTRP